MSRTSRQSTQDQRLTGIRMPHERPGLTMKPSPSSYVVLVIRFGRLQSALQNPQSRPIQELDDAHIGHMALAVPVGAEEVDEVIPSMMGLESAAISNSMGPEVVALASRCALPGVDRSALEAIGSRRR